MKNRNTISSLLAAFIIGLVLISCKSGDQKTSEKQYWENPAVFEENQTIPHAFHVPFTSKESALANDLASNKNFQLLNGEWDFKWYERPELVPENFHEVGFDISKWDKIKVPANWQMEGFGHPKFRNIALSFESDPPNIPDYFNPTGLYKRAFNVDESWGEKEVFIRFEGVRSAAYIYVNGKYVGYNQGSFEPAEFDVTSFVQKGDNEIALKVIRFCDGSYLENQDMWRLAGIFRDVELYAVPKIHIKDFYYVTDLDENYADASLNIEMDVENFNETNVNGYSINVDVIDAESNSILSAPIVSKKIKVEKGSVNKVKLTSNVANPLKWSAEKPNLYTIVFELQDKNGKTVDAFMKRIGFREVELKDNVITVNGVAVKFNGVNSHMHHPDHGQAVPLETLMKDLITMKQFNINCVRTCHYPPSPEYVEMADEIGMYIVDEVNDEAHFNIHLSADTTFTEMYRDRSKKLVYRDRNHASVVMWSAGNESGSGPNIDVVIKTGKAIDPSRPVWMYGGNTVYMPYEDVIGPRYWDPSAVRYIAEDKIFPADDQRPSFMDEYLAATGNGLGGMDDYWDIIYKYPRLSGGAIWDWISPGVNAPIWITDDISSNKLNAYVMGRPTFVDGKNGRGLKFIGHDDWVEFYRDDKLDIRAKEITIDFWISPSELPGTNTYLSKGGYQYGIIQSHPDTLEFFLHTYERDKENITFSFNKFGSNKRSSIRVAVPKDWYGNWHHVAGNYNGEKMSLNIDYKEVGSLPCRDKISSTPYPLCVGRDAQLHDMGELSGRMASMTIDDVRVFDTYVSIEDLKTTKTSPVIHLDFEKDSKDGIFYSTGLGGRTYGLVWPDRGVQPELHQVKKSTHPVKIERMGASNNFKFTNRYHFNNLNELGAIWEIKVGNKVVKSGPLNIELAAQSSKIVSLPFVSGAKGILTISFFQKEATSWSAPNFEVAWEQFVLSDESKKIIASKSGKITSEETEEVIKVNGSNFEYTFQKATGEFTSMNYKGKEYFERGPVFNLWRAPTANDIDPWGAWYFESEHYTKGKGTSTDNQMRTLGLADLVSNADEITVTKGAGFIEISLRVYSESSNQSSTFERIEKYTITADGTVTLDQKIIPHGDMPYMLPKIGMEFLISKEFNKVDWFGRGPFETYPDRKTAAKLGEYSSTVADMYVPYIIPQDYGNRTDVKWLKLANEENRGFLIAANDVFNFSVFPYSLENLDKAVRAFQLEDASFNTLNVDFEVSGVGGTALRALKQYRVLPTVKENRMTIKPF